MNGIQLGPRPILRIFKSIFNIFSKIQPLPYEVFLSIDNDSTVIRSISKIHDMYSPQYEIIFGNGGDQNNENIPEKNICEKLKIKLIDGLGNKIQSSSWLIKKNES